MIPAFRQAPPQSTRKRGGGGEVVGEAVMDGGGDEGSSVGADSMRPQVPLKKKRRRTIIDAFQLINIRTEHQRKSSSIEISPGSRTDGNSPERNNEDDADSSRAVAEFAEAFSTTSTLEDDDEEDDLESEEDDRLLLSDREESERKVLLDLVFGGPPQLSKDPVENRFQLWLQSQQHDVSQEIKDDTFVEASYHSSRSITNLGDTTGTGTAAGASTSSCSRHVRNPSILLKRSRSLPHIFSDDDDEEEEEDEMSIDL